MSDDAWIVCGLNPVLEILRSPERKVETVWLQEGPDNPRFREVVRLARERRLVIRGADRHFLERLAEGSVHQGVVVKVAARPGLPFENLLAELEEKRALLLLLLDGVEDPRNLGAILRSAEGAGVRAVIMTRDRAAPLNAAAIKAASGAAEGVDLCRVTNLARTMEALREAGVFLVGLEAEADGVLYDAELTGPLGLVVGGEGKGLRRLTRERCDRLLSIPLAGKTGSLNASVAVAVALFEAVRQRRASAGVPRSATTR